MGEPTYTNRHTRELDIFYKEHRSQCSLCGKLFSNGDLTYLGYVRNFIKMKPAYSCDNCVDKLVEVVAGETWEESNYEIPTPNTILWRYMNLSKFISLVSSRELYFASAESFSKTDPFEGAMGIADNADSWYEWHINYFRDEVLAPLRENRTDGEYEQLVKSGVQEYSTLCENSRKHTFLNCWHMSEYESEAMWRLYSGGNNDAVAIQTTYKRLYESIDRAPNVNIGMVRYTDYAHEIFGINNAYWCKRKSFDYEKEVRAIIVDQDRENGVKVPVNVDVLIENLYVSPYAPEWFYEVVQSVVEKYSLNKTILHSQMKATPFYSV